MKGRVSSTICEKGKVQEKQKDANEEVCRHELEQQV